MTRVKISELLTTKKKLLASFVSMFTGFCLSSSCGTWAGNPVQPDEDSKKVNIPQIDSILPGLTSDEENNVHYEGDDALAVPSEVAGSFLTLSNQPAQSLKSSTSNLSTEEEKNTTFEKLEKNPVKLQISMLSFARSYINRTTKELGESLEIGPFEGKGKYKDISGLLKEVSIESYKYQLSVCKDGAPFLKMLWNLESTKITSTVNLNSNAFSDKSSETNTSGDRISTIELVKSTEDNTSVRVLNIGNWRYNKNTDVDGDFLRNNLIITKTADTYDFSAVGDRNNGDISAPFETDFFYLGRSNEHGEGVVVGYNKAGSACQIFDDGFPYDEMFTIQPNDPLFPWCQGRSIKGESFESAGERYDTAQELKNITVETDSDFTGVSFSQEDIEDCP